MYDAKAGRSRLCLMGDGKDVLDSASCAKVSVSLEVMRTYHVTMPIFDCLDRDKKYLRWHWTFSNVNSGIDANDVAG